MTAIIAWPAPIWTKSKAEGSRLILLKGHFTSILPLLILDEQTWKNWMISNCGLFLQSLAPCASAAIVWHISHHVAWPELQPVFSLFLLVGLQGETKVPPKSANWERTLALVRWVVMESNILYPKDNSYYPRAYVYNFDLMAIFYLWMTFL